MRIFDGTVRPALNVTIDGTAIPDDDVLEFAYFRGRKQWDNPLGIGRLSIMLNTQNGDDYDWINAGDVAKLELNTADQFNGYVRTSTLVGNINPLRKVEILDAVWTMENTIIPEAYLNDDPGESTDDLATRMVTDYGLGVGVFDNGTSPGAVSLTTWFGDLSALSVMEKVSDTEVGPMYVTRNGDLYMASNSDKTTRTSVFTLSDNPGTGEVPYADAQLTPAGQLLINSCVAQRADRVGNYTTSIAATYTSSVTSYGLFERKWGTFAAAENSVRATAVYLSKLYATPAETIRMVEINGLAFDRKTASYSLLTGLDIGDKLTVERQGNTYTVMVEGIEQAATGQRWTIRLYLSPYDSYTVDIASGLTVPQTGFTFSESQTIRPANSTDVKWEDFSDRGSAGATGQTVLVMWCDRKQIAVYDTNSSGSYEINIRGGYVDGTSTNDLKVSQVMKEDQCATFHILVKCNNSSHYATAVKIDGSTTNVTTIWIGGAPTSGKSGGWDSYNITVYLVDPTTSPATYRVEASHGASA